MSEPVEESMPKTFALALLKIAKSLELMAHHAVGRARAWIRILPNRMYEHHLVFESEGKSHNRFSHHVDKAVQELCPFLLTSLNSCQVKVPDVPEGMYVLNFGETLSRLLRCGINVQTSQYPATTKISELML